MREQAQRWQTALNLKRAGKTLEEIGATLGVTRQRAAILIAKAERENA